MIQQSTRGGVLLPIIQYTLNLIEEIEMRSFNNYIRQHKLFRPNRLAAVILIFVALSLMLTAASAAMNTLTTKSVAGSTAVTKADITNLQNQINALKQQVNQLKSVINVGSQSVTINKKLIVSNDLDVKNSIKAGKNIEAAVNITAGIKLTQGSKAVATSGSPVSGTVIVPGAGVFALKNGKVK